MFVRTTFLYKNIQSHGIGVHNLILTIYLGPLVFMLPNTFRLFGFQLT
jgi:hypothetical protein